MVFCLLKYRNILYFLLGFRQSPFYQPVDEEVEAHHLRFLQQPPSKFFEAVARFNANISYSGLLHAVTQDTLFAENKEKLIVQGLTALLANECKYKEIVHNFENMQYAANM